MSGHSTLDFPSLTYPDLTDSVVSDIKNNNIYVNSSYQDYFDKWKLYSGLSYSKNIDNITWDTFPGYSIPLGRIQELTQAKAFVTHPFINASSDIKFGGEVQSQNFTDSFGIYKYQIKEIYSAAFVESDLYITRKLAARIGGRAEYSKLLNKYNAAPRLSLAYKTGDKTQVSNRQLMAIFIKRPIEVYVMELATQNPYFYKTSGMTYELATHYILDYQYMDDDRTFRI